MPQFFDWVAERQIKILQLVREASILRLASHVQTSVAHSTNATFVAEHRVNRTRKMRWAAPEPVAAAVRAIEARMEWWTERLEFHPNIAYHYVAYEQLVSAGGAACRAARKVSPLAQSRSTGRAPAEDALVFKETRLDPRRTPRTRSYPKDTCNPLRYAADAVRFLGGKTQPRTRVRFLRHSLLQLHDRECEDRVERFEELVPYLAGTRCAAACALLANRSLSGLPPSEKRDGRCNICV